VKFSSFLIIKLFDDVQEPFLFLWQLFPPSVPAFLPPLRSGKKSSTQVGLQSQTAKNLVKVQNLDKVDKIKHHLKEI
jgi:hypothetical protein